MAVQVVYTVNLIPMPPLLGPPLPTSMGVYWPWIKPFKYEVNTGGQFYKWTGVEAGATVTKTVNILERRHVFFNNLYFVATPLNQSSWWAKEEELEPLLFL